MTHSNDRVVTFLVLAFVALASLGCLLIPTVFTNSPGSTHLGRRPSLRPSQPAGLPPLASPPPGSQSPTATQPTVKSSVPAVPSVPAASEVPTQPQAAACDMLRFIKVTEGAARSLTFSQQCTADCSQAVTFTNTHPSERIKLLFLETTRARPDQGGFNGEQWNVQILGPGESVDMNQFNRTPHADACPWSVRDFSLVGAIPLGAGCAWVEADPATSLLPLQEVENACR